MVPLTQFMPDALAAVIRKAPLTPEKVAFAWRTAVGPGMHNATTIEFHEGVLRVAVKDRAWKKEVERSAALIRTRLDALLGADVVRTVVVTAPGRSPWEGGSGTGRRGR